MRKYKKCADLREGRLNSNQFDRKGGLLYHKGLLLDIKRSTPLIQAVLKDLFQDLSLIQGRELGRRWVAIALELKGFNL